MTSHESDMAWYEIWYGMMHELHGLIWQLNLTLRLSLESRRFKEKILREHPSTENQPGKPTQSIESNTSRSIKPLLSTSMFENLFVPMGQGFWVCSPDVLDVFGTPVTPSKSWGCSPVVKHWQQSGVEPFRNNSIAMRFGGHNLETTDTMSYHLMWISDPLPPQHLSCHPTSSVRERGCHNPPHRRPWLKRFDLGEGKQLSFIPNHEVHSILG